MEKRGLLKQNSCVSNEARKFLDVKQNQFIIHEKEYIYIQFTYNYLAREPRFYHT